MRHRMVGARMLLAAMSITLVFNGMPALSQAAAWNPFERVPEKPNLVETVRQLLRTLFSDLERSVGRAVSAFRIPDPSRIGLRAQSFYQPPVLSATAEAPTSSGQKTAVVPTPAPSETPGTKSAFWASDCSCHQGQTCTDNAEVLCGEPKCPQKLTIGDKDLTTRAHCLQHRHAPSTAGGSPRFDGHF